MLVPKCLRQNFSAYCRNLTKFCSFALRGISNLFRPCGDKITCFGTFESKVLRHNFSSNWRNITKVCLSAISGLDNLIQALGSPNNVFLRILVPKILRHNFSTICRNLQKFGSFALSGLSNLFRPCGVKITCFQDHLNPMFYVTTFRMIVKCSEIFFVRNERSW